MMSVVLRIEYLLFLQNEGVSILIVPVFQIYMHISIFLKAHKL